MFNNLSKITVILLFVLSISATASAESPFEYEETTSMILEGENLDFEDEEIRYEQIASGDEYTLTKVYYDFIECESGDECTEQAEFNVDDGSTLEVSTGNNGICGMGELVIESDEKTPFAQGFVYAAHAEIAENVGLVGAILGYNSEELDTIQDSGFEIDHLSISGTPLENWHSNIVIGNEDSETCGSPDSQIELELDQFNVMTCRDARATDTAISYYEEEQNQYNADNAWEDFQEDEISSRDLSRVLYGEANNCQIEDLPDSVTVESDKEVIEPSEELGLKIGLFNENNELIQDDRPAIVSLASNDELLEAEYDQLSTSEMSDTIGYDLETGETYELGLHFERERGIATDFVEFKVVEDSGDEHGVEYNVEFLKDKAELGETIEIGLKTSDEDVDRVRGDYRLSIGGEQMSEGRATLSEGEEDEIAREDLSEEHLDILEENGEAKLEYLFTPDDSVQELEASLIIVDPEHIQEEYEMAFAKTEAELGESIALMITAKDGSEHVSVSGSYQAMVNGEVISTGETTIETGEEDELTESDLSQNQLEELESEGVLEFKYVFEPDSRDQELEAVTEIVRESDYSLEFGKEQVELGEEMEIKILDQNGESLEDVTGSYILYVGEEILSEGQTSLDSGETDSIRLGDLEDVHEEQFGQNGVAEMEYIFEVEQTGEVLSDTVELHSDQFTVPEPQIYFSRQEVELGEEVQLNVLNIRTGEEISVDGEVRATIEGETYLEENTTLETSTDSVDELRESERTVLEEEGSVELEYVFTPDVGDQNYTATTTLVEPEEDLEERVSELEEEQSRIRSILNQILGAVPYL